MGRHTIARPPSSRRPSPTNAPPSCIPPKAEKLGSKFAMLSSKIRATDPEGGEPRSQAYYVIKVRSRPARGRAGPWGSCREEMDARTCYSDISNPGLQGIG